MWDACSRTSSEAGTLQEERLAAEEAARLEEEEAIREADALVAKGGNELHKEKNGHEYELR